MRKIITALIFISFFFVPQLVNAQQTVLLNENFDASWGTWGNNPPTGWTIFMYGNLASTCNCPTGTGTPDATWDSNNWFRYTGTPKPSGSVATARIRYSPRKCPYDDLVSPAVSFPGTASACTLSFWTAYDQYAGCPDTAMILADTGLGTYDVVIDKWYADKFWSSGGGVKYDITSWAKGKASVKFNFRYYASYGGEWNIDNVQASYVQVFAHDAGTTAILSPTGTVGGASSFTVSANVKNFGQNTESFNVTAEIIPLSLGSTYSSVASVSSLGPGTSTTVVFPDAWVPTDSGSYTVKVYTQLAGE